MRLRGNANASLGTLVNEAVCTAHDAHLSLAHLLRDCQAAQVLLVLTSMPADNAWLLQALDFQCTAAHAAAGSQRIRQAAACAIALLAGRIAARHAAAGALLAWHSATGLKVFTV